MTGAMGYPAAPLTAVANAQVEGPLMLRWSTLHMYAQVDELIAGEVGYLAASIKAVADARVGDTITLKKNQAQEALAGYLQVMPMVYCGLFPTDADQFETLREALGRLQLNDAALQYEPEVLALPSVTASATQQQCTSRA